MAWGHRTSPLAESCLTASGSGCLGRISSVQRALVAPLRRRPLSQGSPPERMYAWASLDTFDELTVMV